MIRITSELDFDIARVLKEQYHVLSDAQLPGAYDFSSTLEIQFRDNLGIFYAELQWCLGAVNDTIISLPPLADPNDASERQFRALFEATRECLKRMMEELEGKIIPIRVKNLEVRLEQFFKKFPQAHILLQNAQSHCQRENSFSQGYNDWQVFLALTLPIKMETLTDATYDKLLEKLKTLIAFRMLKTMGMPHTHPMYAADQRSIGDRSLDLPDWFYTDFLPLYFEQNADPSRRQEFPSFSELDSFDFFKKTTFLEAQECFEKVKRLKNLGAQIEDFPEWENIFFMEEHDDIKDLDPHQKSQCFQLMKELKLFHVFREYFEVVLRRFLFLRKHGLILPSLNKNHWLFSASQDIDALFENSEHIFKGQSLTTREHILASSGPKELEKAVEKDRKIKIIKTKTLDASGSCSWEHNAYPDWLLECGDQECLSWSVLRVEVDAYLKTCHTKNISLGSARIHIKKMLGLFGCFGVSKNIVAQMAERIPVWVGDFSEADQQQLRAVGPNLLDRIDFWSQADAASAMTHLRAAIAWLLPFSPQQQDYEIQRPVWLTDQDLGLLRGWALSLKDFKAVLVNQETFRAWLAKEQCIRGILSAYHSQYGKPLTTDISPYRVSSYVLSVVWTPELLARVARTINNGTNHLRSLLLASNQDQFEAILIQGEIEQPLPQVLDLGHELPGALQSQRGDQGASEAPHPQAPQHPESPEPNPSNHEDSIAPQSPRESQGANEAPNPQAPQHPESPEPNPSNHEDSIAPQSPRESQGANEAPNLQAPQHPESPEPSKNQRPAPRSNSHGLSSLDPGTPRPVLGNLKKTGAAASRSRSAWCVTGVLGAATLASAAIYPKTLFCLSSLAVQLWMLMLVATILSAAVSIVMHCTKPSQSLPRAFPEPSQSTAHSLRTE